ncbi:MAG: hypothetical protein ACXWQJ_18250, partial [Bdellovibrionota bacterium]
MCYLLARLFASKNKGKLAFAIFLFILSALRVGIYFQSERTISTGKNVHRNFIGLTTVEMEWLNGQRNG